MGISLYNRIIYHIKRRKKSPFSDGYITASKDYTNKKRGSWFESFYKKRLDELNQKRILSEEDKWYRSYYKGHKAFYSDLKK